MAMCLLAAKLLSPNVIGPCEVIDEMLVVPSDPVTDIFPSLVTDPMF